MLVAQQLTKEDLARARLHASEAKERAIVTVARVRESRDRIRRARRQINDGRR